MGKWKIGREIGQTKVEGYCYDYFSFAFAYTGTT